MDGRYQVQRSVMGRGLGTPGEPEVRGEGSRGHVETESPREILQAMAF